VKHSVSQPFRSRGILRFAMLCKWHFTAYQPCYKRRPQLKFLQMFEMSLTWYLWLLYVCYVVELTIDKTYKSVHFNCAKSVSLISILNIIIDFLFCRNHSRYESNHTRYESIHHFIWSYVSLLYKCCIFYSFVFLPQMHIDLSQRFLSAIVH